MLLGLAKRGVTWSDGQIGDWTGLDRATVSRVRAELKNRPDVDIPYEIEVYTKDGRVYIMKTPIVPPRWDPSAGYQHDPLFDELPNADEYLPPPTPARSQGGARYGGRQSGGRNIRQQTGDHMPVPPSNASSTLSSLGRRDPEVTPNLPSSVSENTPSDDQLVQPPAGTLNMLSGEVYDCVTYRRPVPNGSLEQVRVESQAINLLPPDIREQILRDLEIPQLARRALADRPELCERVLRSLGLES